MAERVIHLPDDEYVAVIARSEELARLEAQVRKRKSMLVFGPEGVGKTRLLQTFAKTQPYSLYVPHLRNPKDTLQALFEGLRALKKRELRLPESTRSLSTPSLKGIVRRALTEFPFVLVLDHVAGPSRVVTGLIKDFSDYDQRSIIFAARSPHMEDIGALQPMCADRSERLELKNLPAPIALEFARQEAIRAGVEARNLEATLHSIVEWSGGNPGGILRMLKMARMEKYRTEDQVKAHVLHLDFLMGTQKA